jgi:predicted Zn-dependent protease
MAVLVAGSILQGCVLAGLENVKPEPSFTSSFVRPDDPQEAIGAREHPLVLAKYGGEYRNEEAEKLLALIVGRLISVSDDPKRVFKVTILDTPSINAFALPGGYLYLTRGLLALANDSAEIAAVIAHEMAHVSANHAIIRQERLAGTQVGQEVVNEVLGDSVAARVAMAANRLKLADFSREQELQADAIGIRMTGRAGYDPYAAARFLKTMQAYQAYKSGASGLEDDTTFMSSHPTTPQRIELARRHARFFGSPGFGERDRARYLAGIDGMMFGDAADEGYVRGSSFSHAGLGISFSAPEGARMDNQQKAIIISGPGEVATRFDAALIGKWQSLTNYLKSGWINGLIPGSITESGKSERIPWAVAEAEADGWRFRIRIFQLGERVYRFITAAPADQGTPVAISEEITGTFREITEEETEALAPLRIRIVEVRPGDTLGSLAARMLGGENRLKLLRLINGLAAGEVPQPGNLIKLVSD